MKTLTRIFFCIFAITFFYSCEPEELETSSSTDLKSNVYAPDVYATGDQETPIDDKKD